MMNIIQTDVAIVGAGGAGLRAAIAVAEAYPNLDIALISKVYPMRSHTVAAEGGAAAVTQTRDSFESHFNDTVSGGDWLCDQDVVDYFVHHAPAAMIQLERWGCPWSRQADGQVNVRAFGGMAIERTWFAADKTGFHLLHTLFQTSLRYAQIRRLDEFFCCDLLIAEGQVQGILVIHQAEGAVVLIAAKSVILATGGAGRLYQYNTNGGIVTGDGMALAYRHGVPLRDMEFVQYHPTTLPGTGILISEGCRGEGGILVNADGYRYLQDYGLGPETPPGQPQSKCMELGPRDRLSQAFWHEAQQGRTFQSQWGAVVHLDLRHLGPSKICDRLPNIRELTQTYMGLDPIQTPIPVRPAVHYTMGGIQADWQGATCIQGLYAVGECASNGLHGANRLGSNSLTEVVVFGKVVGEAAAVFAAEKGRLLNEDQMRDLARQPYQQTTQWLEVRDGTETLADLRQALTIALETGLGIYREAEGMQAAIVQLTDLKERYSRLKLTDRSTVFNTEWLAAIELGYMLDVALAIAHSALARQESRGSHQRLDGFGQRDDENFLKHTLAHYRPDRPPTITYQEVVITRSQPQTRAYGAAAQSLPMTGGTTL